MRYIMIGLALAGCAGEPDSEASAERTKVGYTAFEAGGAEIPQGAIDPVSGEWVPTDTAHKSLYEGLTYYFASKANVEAFDRRPHAFVTPDGYLKKPLDEVRREAEVK